MLPYDIYLGSWFSRDGIASFSRLEQFVVLEFLLPYLEMVPTYLPLQTHVYKAPEADVVAAGPCGELEQRCSFLPRPSVTGWRL